MADIRGFNVDGWVPLYYVEKSMIKRIKESNIPTLYVYPMDKPLLDLAHSLGGKASDIVKFINPDDGRETIFFAGRV